MSLLFPDRNGTWSATDDSRLSLDITGDSGWLTDDYGLLLIGVGNPLLAQDHFSEYDGGTNHPMHLITNQNQGAYTSPGFWSVHFGAWADVGTAEVFSLRFRPNGGSQVQFYVESPVVTHTNCAYIGIERNGDDYAIHLYDKDGNKTAGTPKTHVAGSLGLTARSSARTVYVGSSSTLQATQTNGHWRSMMENLIRVEQTSAFTSLDTKIANIIAGGSDPVTEFGVANVKTWRTLEDLTASGLAAHPSATSDTLPAIQVAAFSRVEVGSPIACPAYADAVRLDERKYNFHGLQGNESSTTLSVTGTYIGTVTNVEGRLMNKADDSEVQAWTTLEAAVTGGTWSGSFANVPAGEYYIELRPSNATSNVYKGRNYHTVAYVMLMHGQSQMEIMLGSLSGLEDSYSFAESLPATAKGYYVGSSQHSTYGMRVSVARFSGEDDYPAGYQAAQVEWERYHAGVPVVWVDLAISGSSLLQWLTDDSGDKVGDGVTWNSGKLTDVRLALGTDKANIVYQWITSNLSTVEEDYRNLILGWLFDSYSGTGTDYSGPTYNHITDFFDASFGFVLSPPTRATTINADNYTADPVADDYGSITEKRELQRTLVGEWAADGTKTGRYIVGPAVNDMHIEAAGGPHQPSFGSEPLRYFGGVPRLAARLGIAAAWLADTTDYVTPTIGAPSFTSDAKTAFSVPVNTGSFGALKNGAGTATASGFEVSTDGGSTWNRKGFSEVISGNTVVITKDSGDWTGVAEGDLRVRYHKGGPYSFGTSYTAEADTAITHALYATAANEDGLGIPVDERTDLASGGITVAAAANDPASSGFPMMAARITAKPITAGALVGRRVH